MFRFLNLFEKYLEKLACEIQHKLVGCHSLATFAQKVDIWRQLRRAAPQPTNLIEVEFLERLIFDVLEAKSRGTFAEDVAHCCNRF